MISKLKSRYSAREWAYIKAAYKRTVPFAICFLLLLTAGFLYISNFGKGIWHAFCYTILPVLAGITASVIFKKLHFQENLCESSGKVKAAHLASFTLIAVIFGLMKNPDGSAPSMMFLFIPVVYSMYVTAIPYKYIAKPIICGLFCAGALLLSVLRPTGYMGDGLFAVLIALLSVTVTGIINNRFGCNRKVFGCIAAVMVFAVFYTVISSATHITPNFTPAINSADIASVTPAEVMNNIGLVPTLLIGILYLAASVFGFILSAGKSSLLKKITVSVTVIFAFSCIMSLLNDSGHLPNNFGLPILECSELSTAIILLFTVIILNGNRFDTSVHALADSVLYESPYTGAFGNHDYTGGKLLIVQGPSGSGKTRYLHEIIEKEPGTALYFTIETVFERLLQALQENGTSISIHPECIFPEIEKSQVSLIVIDDIDMKLAGKTVTQAEFAKLLNTLMVDHGISVVIAGIQLCDRVPALWDGLTNYNNERVCEQISLVEI